MTDRGGAGFSARARILAWMLLLVTGALFVSVFATYEVLLSRLDVRLEDELGHEVDKFRGFTKGGLNPATGEAYTGVEQVLEVYLYRSLPEEHETYVAVVDGVPYKRSAKEPPARIDQNRELIKRITDVDAPATGWIETSAGEARYAAIPVTVDGRDEVGHLVVAEFRDVEAADINEAMVVLILVGLAAIGLAGIGGWLAAGRILAPVRLVRNTAERISETDLSERIPVRGRDDVAALTQTFNTMLDRLEESFAAQREFVDDAGHELRTPITVVRGHLELLGQGIDDADERAETLRLVMDELDRMRRIVDDLLVLAKSGTPDFLRPADVDLAELTVEVVAKVRTLGDRRFVIDEMAETVIRSDEQRLTQALMQLVANAVRHTGPGDEIGVGSSVTEQRVRLWVRDSGPGVAAADRERIFERFVTGPARDREGNGSTGSGAGLGLAIVRAIAEAHGGRVTVTDAGDGAASDRRRLAEAMASAGGAGAARLSRDVSAGAGGTAKTPVTSAGRGTDEFEDAEPGGAAASGEPATAAGGAEATGPGMAGSGGIAASAARVGGREPAARAASVAGGAVFTIEVPRR
ncbi:sensor histidine kinase [Stackebrandtia nassauensis]|nr:HAMP domain-containing sensor histidine kinase [Stackebrandtia nassauensis]